MSDIKGPRKSLQWNINSVEVEKTKRDRFHECFLILRCGDEELRLLNWSDEEILKLAFKIISVLVRKNE